MLQVSVCQKVLITSLAQDFDRLCMLLGNKTQIPLSLSYTALPPGLALASDFLSPLQANGCASRGCASFGAHHERTGTFLENAVHCFCCPVQGASNALAPGANLTAVIFSGGFHLPFFYLEFHPLIPASSS